MDDKDFDLFRITIFRENIYVFDCFTVEIFAELYRRFPVKTKISGYDVVKNCKYETNERIDGLEKMILLKSTFEWLKENEFITYTGNIDEGDGMVYDCILTLKGLNALENVPKSIKKRMTIGQKIITEIKQGSHDIAIELIKQAIKIGS